MSKKIISDRQEGLTSIITDALKDPNIIEALQAFQMSQVEYARAINGSMNIKIFSSSKANPGEKPDAGMD